MSFRRVQSRRASLLEAGANVLVGYLVAVLAQQLVFPLFGIDTTERAVSKLTAKVTPKKVTVDRTRAKVHATVASSEGELVDDGVVTVYQGDRILGTDSVEDGEAKIRLPRFSSTGTKTLIVSYGGGTPADSSTTVMVKVGARK